jgi:hypothetical protein
VLTETELTGTGNRFRAALNAHLAYVLRLCPFDGVQGKEEALANFTIRTPLGNELQYLVLSFAQGLTKRLGRASGPARSVARAPLVLSVPGCQQRPCIVRHHPACSGFCYQLSHGQPFVEKDTDQAAWPGQRQRVMEHLHRRIQLAWAW